MARTPPPSSNNDVCQVTTPASPPVTLATEGSAGRLERVRWNRWRRHSSLLVSRHSCRALRRPAVRCLSSCHVACRVSGEYAYTSGLLHPSPLDRTLSALPTRYQTPSLPLPPPASLGSATAHIAQCTCFDARRSRFDAVGNHGGHNTRISTLSQSTKTFSAHAAVKLLRMHTLAHSGWPCGGGQSMGVELGL